MGYNFDGSTKVISLTAGTTSMSVRDLYSRWKEWVATGTNARFLPAFSTVGGDPLGGGVYVTFYAFLANGWRIRPQEASHTLTVTDGVITTDDGSDPFIATLGAYNVQIKYSQPVKTETVATGGGSAPSVSEIAAAILAAAQLAPIYADARRINGTTLAGSGVEGDSWRPA